MVMFLVILPVTVRNLLVGRDATLIASSGGINFYIGNNEHADGLSATLPPPLTNDWRITDIKYAAESATGREMTPSEISSFYYEFGWNWILNNKLDFIKLYLKKLYYSLNNFEISNNRNLIYEFSNNGLLSILPISFWLIIGLTVLGLFAPADSPNRKRLKIFLIMFPLLYILTISFYFINARFRLPILPLLFILAASGAIWLYNNIKTGQNLPKTAIALLMGIIVSAFSLTNLYHHDSGDISGGLFNRANNYFAAGDLPTAADYYRRVLSNRPDYPEAALNLGALFLKTGRVDSARIYFEREYRLYPDNPRILANLASLQYLDGNHDSAIVLADRAIALRPYFDDPHLVKLRALAAQNDIAGIYRLLEIASRTIPDPARLYLDAGIIFSEIKDFDDAEKYLSLAFTAEPAPSETDDAAFSNIHKISGRDIILIGGGLFLLAKATHEIHVSLEGAGEKKPMIQTATMAAVLVQIAILDIVFSLDSVITAVGLAQHLSIMAIAIVLAVCVMLLAAKSIAEFVDEHPTIKILALSFLILVGATLIVEGFDVHVPKGYIYFAMAFSVSVEMINLKLRKRETEPVRLRRKNLQGAGKRRK